MNTRLLICSCIALTQIYFSSLLSAADKPQTEAGQGFLDTMVLPEVTLKQVPLDVAIKRLEELSKLCDTKKTLGIIICLRLGPEVRPLPLVSFSATNVTMRTAIEGIVMKAGLCYEYKEYLDKTSKSSEHVIAIGSKKHAKRLLPKEDPAFTRVESQFSFEVFAIPLKQCAAIEAVLPVLDENANNQVKCQTPEYRAAMARAVAAFSKTTQGRRLVKTKKGWYPNSVESIEKENERSASAQDETIANPETFVAQIVPETDPITEKCNVVAQISVWLSRKNRKSFDEEMDRFSFVANLQKNEAAIALVKPTDDKSNAYIAKITYMGVRVKK